VIFERILATTDGSEGALRGVEVAAQVVARYQCEFIVISVVAIPQHVALAATMDQRAIAGYVERMAQESLRPATDLLCRMGVGAEIKALVGSAPEVILAEVTASRADLVVMGRSDRYEPKDLILGSVSNRVARHVTVPILLVP